MNILKRVVTAVSVKNQATEIIAESQYREAIILLTDAKYGQQGTTKGYLYIM